MSKYFKWTFVNRYSLFVIQNHFLFPPPTITFPAITPNNRPMTKPIFTLFKNIPIARPMISNVKKPIFLLGCMLLIFRKCYKVSQYLNAPGFPAGNCLNSTRLTYANFLFHISRSLNFRCLLFRWGHSSTMAFQTPGRPGLPGKCCAPAPIPQNLCRLFCLDN
jgi:hypothetical protein